MQRNGSAIRLTHADIDTFQRAKSAIGVGISKLLAAAGLSGADLGRVCVCGVFGQHLNIGSAQLIGLLPTIAHDRIELCGNTALAGCERLLVGSAGFSPSLVVRASARSSHPLDELRNRAEVLNLSQADDFESLFLENLYLQPLREDRASSSQLASEPDKLLEGRP